MMHKNRVVDHKTKKYDPDLGLHKIIYKDII